MGGLCTERRLKLGGVGDWLSGIGTHGEGTWEETSLDLGCSVTDDDLSLYLPFHWPGGQLILLTGFNFRHFYLGNFSKWIMQGTKSS